MFDLAAKQPMPVCPLTRFKKRIKLDEPDGRVPQARLLPLGVIRDNFRLPFFFLQKNLVKFFMCLGFLETVVDLISPMTQKTLNLQEEIDAWIANVLDHPPLNLIDGRDTGPLNSFHKGLVGSPFFGFSQDPHFQARPETVRSGQFIRRLLLVCHFILVVLCYFD